MAKGINIDNTASPRSLALDGVEVAQGGNANSAGLYAVGGDLYLDGQKIAEGEDNNGLLVKDGHLYFGGVEVGGDTPTPPTPVESDLWIPPTQEAGALNKYTYETLLQAYDGLMVNSSYNGTIKKYEYKETQTGTETLTASGGGDHVVPVYGHSFTEVSAGSYSNGGDVADLSYPLYHYVFSPANYTKTYVLQAAVHGNEKDSAQTLFRIMDIICNHCNEAGYARLAQLRDNVRFIVIPCVSPVGYNESGMNVPFTNWASQNININLNRNYDIVQQYAISSGVGGNYPFQRSEVRHVKAVIEKFGAQNIDYFVDYHDGSGVWRHFWWNYCMDGVNGQMARKLLADQIAYEEQLIAQGSLDDVRRPLSYVVKAGNSSINFGIANYSYNKRKLTIAIDTQAVADAINANGITLTGSSYFLNNVVKTSGETTEQIRSDYSTLILPDVIQSSGASASSVTIKTYTIRQVEYTLSVNVGDEIVVYVTPASDNIGWINPDVIDCYGYSTGIASSWGNVTMGIPTSVCEYIGGFFGYSFNAEQMTRSLRFRANLLIYAYEMINTKGWTINEAEDADYFSWDYPPSMTRIGLRKDGVSSTEDVQIVSHQQVYSRWDKLASANPSYITKSASLGQNAGGNDIYCYTLGSGAKKVLFLGGSMRYAVNAKDTEMGMYMLAEWLCSPYLLNQSAFLQRIKNNYTIVVLPCIDITAGANTSTWPINQRSLNNSFEGNGSKAKWIVSNGKCTPKYNDIADVNIFLAWITNHTDALVLLSGGEKTATTSTVGKPNPNYSTDYMTQFIVPKNQPTPQWLTDYCTHLEDDRGEDAPDVENTAGLTCGDYFFDNYGKPTFFINLNVSKKWEERNQYADSGDSADAYMYRNYETGRRVANIVNIILMAGGDIAAGGGLINNE